MSPRLGRLYSGVSVRKVASHNQLAVPRRFLPTPVAGIVVNKTVENSPMESMREGVNVHFYKGAVEKLQGITQVGTALDGPVIGICEFLTLEDTSYLVALTESTAYYYDPGSDWVQIETGLSGDVLAQQASMCVADGAFIFTNGTDLKRWEGSGGLDDQITTLPAGLSTLTCKYVAFFGGRLILGYTTEDSVAVPQRIRYSALNNTRDFDSAGSGFIDISDNPQAIKGLIPLGDSLFILKERSIYYARLTGNSAYPFYVRVLSEDVGALFPHASGVLGDRGWIVGWDGIYTFGAPGVQLASEAIREEFFQILSRYSPSRAWAVPVEAFSEVLVGLPDDYADHPTSGWIFNYTLGSWTRFNIDGAAGMTTAGASRTSSTAPTIGSLGGSIDSQTWILGEVVEPVPTAYLGAIGGEVYAVNSVYPPEASWNDETMTAYFDSQIQLQLDEAVAEYEVYLKELRIAYFQTTENCTLTVMVSVNDGETWDYTDTVTLLSDNPGELSYVSAFFWVHTTAFRYRIYNSAAGERFRIKSVTAIFSLGAEP